MSGRLAVVERDRYITIGRAARDLVRDVEANPDDELESQVRPASRQAPGCLGDEARHDYPILTSVPVVGISPGRALLRTV